MFSLLVHAAMALITERTRQTFLMDFAVVDSKVATTQDPEVRGFASESDHDRPSGQTGSLHLSPLPVFSITFPQLCVGQRWFPRCLFPSAFELMGKMVDLYVLCLVSSREQPVLITSP